MISIITPVFNQADTLEISMDSVIKQTHEDIEYILVDNLSTDSSKEIYEKYVENIDKLVLEKDEGIYDAMNKGLQAASGDIICFLGGDDKFASKDICELVAGVFKLNPGIDVIYGDVNFTNKLSGGEITRIWRSSPFKRHKLKYGWMPPHPSMFVRRTLFTEIGCFNAQYKVSGDYDFVLRAFTREQPKAYYLQRIMVTMQSGGTSGNSPSRLYLKLKEDYKALVSNHYGIFWSVLIMFLKRILKFNQFFVGLRQAK